MKGSPKNSPIKVLVFFLCISFYSFQAHAQFGKLGDLVNQNVGKVLNSSQLKMLKSTPITTNFDDCDQKNILPMDFGKDSVRKQLCDIKLAYVSTTGFKLQAGFYSGTFKSFCLQAGTYGPSKGDAYLFAPLLGPKEKTVKTMIANWANHPEIEQRDVQMLIWAILAKTNFSKMSRELQATAAVLLSTKDLSSLSSSIVDYLSGEALESITANLPEPAKSVVELENKIRGVMTSANISYKDVESLAMLAGFAPINDNFPRGVWSRHPKGYYIKYLPSGYASTTVEIYVPKEIGAIDFQPVGEVAVPASRGSQRLGQSSILVCEKK
ncbi:hypothetical protein [Sphingobacterium sp. MYb382]|uniref:hypothetical protein n=1 Tax=Sphingobacterium sp. MYb382 TaxID=2745278 RepID=UPI00309DDB98